MTITSTPFTRPRELHRTRRRHRRAVLAMIGRRRGRLAADWCHLEHLEAGAWVACPAPEWAQWMYCTARGAGQWRLVTDL